MYVRLCTYIVRTAMYVHCTYEPVCPKNFHSECYPYQIRMYGLVRTMYVHCMYICPLGILASETVSQFTFSQINEMKILLKVIWAEGICLVKADSQGRIDPEIGIYKRTP